MKRSTQWDMFGIFALMLGLGVVMSVFGGYMPLNFRDSFSDVILWSVVSGLAFVFCFMGFVFGHLESKKEEFNPSKR